jgi:hypothetical protein
MNGSRMIRVRKRDGRSEAFDQSKLAAAMMRGMCGTQAGLWHASQLAEAMGVYLYRSGVRRVSSAALFQMVCKALRRVGLRAAAVALETHRADRRRRRMRLRIRHDSGAVTRWDKNWLRQIGGRMWGLGPTTAAILAGLVETSLLRNCSGRIDRSAVLDLFNELVCEFGLADAVPARLK